MPDLLQAPNWDLSDLYLSLNDPKIEKDKRGLSRAADKFASSYRGTLSSKTSASVLLKIMQEYEDIMQDANKIIVYAHMMFSTHTEKQAYGSFLQKIKTWSTQIRNSLLFFELELLNLPQTKLESLAGSPILKDYRHYLRKEINRKTHRLSEEQENILNQKSLTGRGAFIRLFNQLSAARYYKVKIGGRKQKLSESAVLSLMYSAKRSERQAANKSLQEGLTKDAPLNSYIFNILAADHAATYNLRKFAGPQASRHLDNEVDQNTVDTLARVVTNNYKTVQDYYRFKKNLLGYDTLYEYDRYAPLMKVNRTFTFKEAREIILTAFKDFSPAFADIAQKFFDNNWIDANQKDGKQGGAYCMYATPQVHPYVFMNYSGNINDVMTLAHELGHAVHGYLAQKQTYLHYDWPLTISETASVFAEMIVFQALKKELKSDQEKLSLYCSRIEGIFATVFRQISMYEFEKKFHDMHAKSGELAIDEINSIWRKSQTDMFGKAVTLTAAENIRWSYVPHFVHTPFYVYAYAFGELLTMSLHSMYEKDGSNFATLYMEMLANGGSKSPQELLRPFKIDIHSEAFWQSGITQIQTIVKEAKKLARK